MRLKNQEKCFCKKKVQIRDSLSRVSNSSKVSHLILDTNAFFHYGNNT